MCVTRQTSCGHPLTRPGESEQLLTILQVAEWLGVSTSTLYHHDPGEGPTRIKFGNSIRYKRCCVAAWLDEHMVIGREASARATATRCCWPPDNSLGR